VVLTLLVAVVVAAGVCLLTLARFGRRRSRHRHRVKRGFVPPAALHQTTMLPDEESADDQTGNPDGQ